MIYTTSCQTYQTVIDPEGWMTPTKQRRATMFDRAPTNTRIAMLIATVLGGTTFGALAASNTGDTLLAGCVAAKEELYHGKFPGGNDEQFLLTFQTMNICLGRAHEALDFLRFEKVGRDVFGVCPPEDATTSQYLGELIKLMRTYPANKKVDFTGVLLSAAAAAWPCH